MSYDTFGQKDAMQQHAGIVAPHSAETKRKAARTVALNVPTEELSTILAMLGLDDE